MSRRAGASDEALVRRLYADHGAALLAYAARITGDRVPAEDVVRETLLRAWRDPGEATRVSLFAIAQQIAAARRHTAGAADPLNDAMATFVALERLPPGEHEVLQSLYFQGRDVAETAGALGLPESAVKSRAYHALRRLRQIIGLSGAPESVAERAG